MKQGCAETDFRHTLHYFSIILQNEQIPTISLHNPYACSPLRLPHRQHAQS